METKLPELRWLNQRTYFLQAEISEEFKTPSAIHFVYGDRKALQFGFATSFSHKSVPTAPGNQTNAPKTTF